MWLKMKNVARNIMVTNGNQSILGYFAVGYCENLILATSIRCITLLHIFFPKLKNELPNTNCFS